MIAIYPYQTKEVRDLAWACFSPSLLRAGQLAQNGQAVSDCGLALTPARRLWLEQLDRDTGELQDHLSRQRSHRLGVYFEHLWHFFLAKDPAVELVAHNLPVHDRGRTLGEFDCIYRCLERQRYYHLELAVKFFLASRVDTTDASTSQWHEWLGPNTRDRLDLKIAHLMSHQIQLGEHPLAREQLVKVGIPEPDIPLLHKEIAFKGYLFQSLADPLPPPRAFNPAARLERWLHICQLTTFLDSADSRDYMVLPKSGWLALSQADTTTAVLNREQLAARLHAELAGDSRPVLVAALDAQGREKHRFFVTAQRWPLAG